MMRASQRTPGRIAAMLHRIAGIALAVFLPVHFIALGTALDGANALDSFFAATNTPLIKIAEGGIVVALAMHLALGMRVLAIEFIIWREPTRIIVPACVAAAFAVGLLFALNVR
jgi:fumarate reductase subunit D